jgi:hypothetical protein
MIYFKIFCTLILVTYTVAGVTGSLMNTDSKRSDLWYKISYISWTVLSVMIIGSGFIFIWFLK